MQHHHGGAPPPPPPPPPPQPGHGGVYAEPPRKNDGIPYIGSRISLISKTDIRYEGFLFNIDTQQSMVALQHVRSFGTEGRRPDHIPPSDQVLPYATFKASEIKDLHVCEAAPPVYGYAPMPPPMPHQPYHPHGVYAQPPLPPGPPATATAPPPPQPPVPQPPAPRQAPPPPQSPPKKSASPAKPKAAPSAGPTLLTPGSVSNANNSARPAPAQPSVPQQQHHQQQKPASPRRVEEAPRSANNDRSAGSRTIPGMGDHLLKRKERRVPGGADGSVSTGQDFNFEQGLTGFDKEEEFSKLNINDNKAKGSYQKSSFFDTISCDALDRLEGKQTRITSGMERKLNTETFGAVGLNNNRRSFRGGRGGGGGRGGNGGRRGRGRNNGSWDGRPREANN